MFGDQKLCAGRVFLDLLAQAVNMGFQRMGADGGIIAPHFVQQHIAPDYLIGGAIEKFQDRGFFFRQPDFTGGIFMHQYFSGWLEFIGADVEDSVFALRMLA